MYKIELRKPARTLNTGDQTIEQAGKGVDTVQSTISHPLGANLENLILLDFTKPEHGLMDGQAILVYGYPKANELDFMQGDAVPEFLGTCALTSIANLLTQAGTPTAEGAVVQRAIENGWTVIQQRHGALKSWRWRDGEPERRGATAGNDAVIEIRRKG